MKKMLTILNLALATFAQAGAGIGTVTTSATGTTYVPIATSGIATAVDLLNTSGTAIAVRLGGTGDTFQVANNVGYRDQGNQSAVQPGRSAPRRQFWNPSHIFLCLPNG